MVKIKFAILFIFILITITSIEIIQTTKNMDTKINCYYHKLAMVNKFAVGKSKKLIAYLKAKAEEKQSCKVFESKKY